MGKRSDGRFERPIIFSGPMIRAILEGRKTETRRPIKFLDGMEVPPSSVGKDAGIILCYWIGHRPSWFGRGCSCTPCAKAPPAYDGTLLWVRETFIIGKAVGGYANGVNPDMNPDGATVDVIYRADNGINERAAGPWMSPIFMPRWASRILLEVDNVSAERLHDITDQGAIAEGFDNRDQFKEAWMAMYPKGEKAWDNNPWVWVIKFAEVDDK